MIPRIKKLEALDDYVLDVVFVDGNWLKYENSKKEIINNI